MGEEKILLPSTIDIRGVGYIAKAISEVILANDYVGGLKDLMTGLGILGLHVPIQQALKEYEQQPNNQ